MDESKRRKRGIVAAAFFLAIIALVVVAPNFFPAKRTTARNPCVNNLRQIDGAKQQWALENHKSTNDIPRVEDVAAYLYHGVFPKCPEGGAYTVGRVDQDPTCSITNHVLRQP